MLYNALMPVILSRADAIITVSESERLSIVNRYPGVAGRISAIQNGGMPVAYTDWPTDVGERGGFVLYVGSLSKRKNFPGMFEVACRLARRRGIHFVFVGSVPNGFSGSDSAVPTDLRSHISFTGQIDDSEVLRAHYRRARCLLFPSFYEASPMPPIEAMACGCPVVASNIPSLIERCGDAALYCDPYSVDSIERAVETVFDDTDLQERLRGLGLAHAAKFTWEACARGVLAVISGDDVPQAPAS
jgi:glycosyltransferase involved in cell wall biosynthesis